jgi:3-oxoacyl-[acyl-carrier protein] reductase
MATIIVAGGATGIGRASVIAFSAQGDNVLLADSNGAGAMAVAEAAGPGPVRVVAMDLADPAAPARAVAAALDMFGGLDTVFVTAAVMTAAPLAHWTVEMWDRSTALNLRMPFLFAQSARAALRQSDHGSIIFTSSTAALRGHAGMPAYHATKAGLTGLCRSLADELGPEGIRVNCILPGWIDTPFNNAFWDHQTEPDARLREMEAKIPLRRQGSPQEVAGTVLFLASAAARYITGSAIVVDGGYTVI